ncbi:MAG: hypothetical protein ACO1OB_32520 [Archangium sp.]
MKRWLWVAMALTGCGSQMTQTDAGSPYVAPRVTTRTPSSLRVVVQPGRCASPLRFSLEVEAMPSATLRSRWLVDESAQSVAFTTEPTSQRSIEQPTGDEFAATLENLPFGTHTVSAYVTDGAFLDGFPVRATNGIVDQAVWVLDVQPCP